MKNKTIMSVFVLATIALLGIGMVSAFPNGNGMMKNHFDGLSEEEQSEMLAYWESVQETIENNDFDSWKSLMESRLTEEHFDLMVERHNERFEMKNLREDMKDAWDNEDYETLSELRENMPERGEVQMKKMRGFEGEGPERDGFFHKLRFW